MMSYIGGIGGVDVDATYVLGLRAPGEESEGGGRVRSW